MKKIALLLLFITTISCSGDDDISCNDAAAASAVALSNFQADNSDANCFALKAALENQEGVCGSLSSNLAGTLASLSCN